METHRKQTISSLILLLSLIAIVLCQEEKIKKPVTSPPRIVREPHREIAYKTDERVELPCQASGEPHPTYEWYKDSKPLEIDGFEIKRQPGSGTIIIEKPDEKYEGVYQCMAKNELGVALTLKAALRLASLETFPSVLEPRVHRPVVGEALKLECVPPPSYPPGLVYWARNKPGTKFTPIETNDRVSTDYQGNLYIANVVEKDDLDAHNYVCIIQNDVLRSMSQGSDAKVYPFNPGPTPPYAAPAVQWTSESPTVVIEGRIKKMKCIFSGFPTPTVRWERIGSPLPPNSESGSFGQELTIKSARFEDAGQYRCLANNTRSGQPVTRNFELRVESLPFWTTEPESVDSSEEETAKFSCAAGGVPKPKVEWYVNGRPIQEVPNDRRTVEDGVVFFSNLSKSDAQVLQCNASNRHGYIFKNAYLNVLAEPPSFTKPPMAVVKVAEGQSINLTCRVFGAPKPIITWRKGDEEDVVSGARFTKQKLGDLQIVDAQLGDEGTYECHAWNKFGEIEESGNLIVRKRTIILVPPETQTVNASEDIILRCDAETDPAEKSKLKIEWHRNGFPIDFTNEGRVSMNMMDNSLKITGCQVRDTAEYTCIASNGLDSTEVTAKLTVRDVPSPPYDVRLASCGHSAAEVLWEPSSDNNDPIINFYVYYNTSFDQPDEYTEGSVVEPDEKRAKISLSPWANYTFHVKARNSLGFSAPSLFSNSFCTTPPMIPYSNPVGVCSRQGEPDELIVTWKNMEPIDHNGEDFRYIVGYKQKDSADSEVIEIEVRNWRQEQLVIANQPTFTQYEIYVVAANQKGRAPDNKLERKIAFSGEDTPTVAPEGLEVDESTLNATYGVFRFQPIENDHKTVRGHFRGYRLAYWKADDPSTRKERDHILHHHIHHCRDLNRFRRHHRHRHIRQVGMEEIAVDDLWPYSKVSAGVMVLNGGKVGVISDPILTFTTPEGPPGVVGSLTVAEHASHHMVIEWTPPFEPNGVLLGYNVKYKPVYAIRGAGDQGDSDMSGPTETLPVMDPLQLSAKLMDLEPDTMYILTVAGITNAGEGVELVSEARTLENMPPDVPGIADVEFGETSLNVSWVPSADAKKNPGQEFYVEIRKAGEDEWGRTDPEGENNWTNITDLEPGESYEIRIVAVNGAGDTSKSPPKTFIVGPKFEPTTAEPTTNAPTTEEPTTEAIAIVPGFPDLDQTTEEEGLVGEVSEPTTSQPTEEDIGGIIIPGLGELPDLGFTTADFDEETTEMIGQVEERKHELATAGWFIGTLCAIIFLILIILIICLIKRNRGGKYPVYEKEKLRGRDPDKEDDPEFGEYTRSDYPDKEPLRRDSLESDRPMGSETDSLAEYGDPELTGGFDEDGSFIKQYGKKPGDNANNAFSTFV
jgi:receptor-type tyrosine-protein phosphatase zeta